MPRLMFFQHRPFLPYSILRYQVRFYSKRRVNAGGNVFAFHWSVRSAPRHIGCPDPEGESASFATESSAQFRGVHHPHGRQLELRHGRHAACSTSPRGIVKPQKFRKKATFEQEHGKRQAALEGVTDATASAHLYNAFYTF